MDTPEPRAEPPHPDAPGQRHLERWAKVAGVKRFAIVSINLDGDIKLSAHATKDECLVMLSVAREALAKEIDASPANNGEGTPP